MISKTAMTYGGALYELAREDSLEAQILAELRMLADLFRENPDYGKLLAEPSIETAQRTQLLDEACRGQVHPYTLNFLKLLCENGAVSQLADCLDAFRGRYNHDYGIMDVCAVSAAPLRPAQLTRLREALSARFGKQIELSARVDTSLLGGIRLELPDRQLDGTVQHHLSQIQQLLSSSAL